MCHYPIPLPHIEGLISALWIPSLSHDWIMRALMELVFEDNKNGALLEEVGHWGRTLESV